MISEKIETIIEEIRFVLTKVDNKQVNNLVKAILKAKKIVVCGAGRTGMATKAFGMRLSHLGISAFSHGDSNLSSIGRGDLLLVSSGSGETQTILDLVKIANKNGAKIALVTGNPRSRMGELANVIVQIKAPSKTKSLRSFKSVQPMTTLNEQCLWIFYDALVLKLMKSMGENNTTMKKRHSNLE